MSELTIITCTGDRPIAFCRCELYLARQTSRDFHWIVVDDGLTETVCSQGQEYVRLPPAASPKESFRANYIAALSRVQTPYFLVAEDDDWYSRWYVEFMHDLLRFGESLLVGESRAKYYNVRHRAWKVHRNTRHASLSQTGFRTLLTRDVMLAYLQSDPNPQQLDGAIWKRCGLLRSQMQLLPVSSHCVALKGTPGRSGLGIDHTLNELRRHDYTFDPNAERLKLWLGGDARHYEECYAAPADC